MESTHDRSVGMWISIDPSLESLFGRLDQLSLEARFGYQRQIALQLALQPYAGTGTPVLLSPLPEELALARLYLYADYFPDDGQLSLIEQLRDVIDVHIPEEERAWLDSVRHSYLDLLEIKTLPEPTTTGSLILRSVADRTEFTVQAAQFDYSVREGQVLLTRLIRRSDQVVLPGTAVVISRSVAEAVLKATNEERRQMEMVSGSFDLGEWQGFAKQYGYLLMWNLAQARLGTLLRSEFDIHFQTQSGHPLLYAVALYEHHEFKFLAGEVDGAGDWHAEEIKSSSRAGDGQRRVWVQRMTGAKGVADAVVARMTLTPSQLLVECDSPQRLDDVKHFLASTFGFSIHFRGEATAVPSHTVILPDIAEEQPGPRSVAASPEEEHRLLATFLESVYLEWADRPSPALGGQTPRHAAAMPDTRPKVAALIDEVEGNDVALHRTKKPGYDYNQLRARVGL